MVVKQDVAGAAAGAGGPAAAKLPREPNTGATGGNSGAAGAGGPAAGAGHGHDGREQQPAPEGQSRPSCRGSRTQARLDPERQRGRPVRRCPWYVCLRLQRGETRRAGA
uniref:Uncharacterized protein n=1 Tax=Aegilops tauschii subsp. strangulata TaxID=200361 RepID=A0A453K040_AEGTS